VRTTFVNSNCYHVTFSHYVYIIMHQLGFGGTNNGKKMNEEEKGSVCYVYSIDDVGMKRHPWKIIMN